MKTLATPPTTPPSLTAEKPDANAGPPHRPRFAPFGSPASCGRSICLLFACAGLGACSYAGKQAAMVPPSMALTKKFKSTVSVRATGGQETSFWSGAPEVANDEIAGAVETAIERSGLFSGVIRGGQGDYRLDVRLIELQQPSFGISFTVESRMEWRLKQPSSDRLVWSNIIVSSFKARASEAFAGAKRLQIANEGAIRENIKTGLEQISQLPL